MSSLFLTPLTFLSASMSGQQEEEEQTITPDLIGDELLDPLMELPTTVDTFSEVETPLGDEVGKAPIFVGAAASARMAEAIQVADARQELQGATNDLRRAQLQELQALEPFKQALSESEIQLGRVDASLEQVDAALREMTDIPKWRKILATVGAGMATYGAGGDSRVGIAMLNSLVRQRDSRMGTLLSHKESLGRAREAIVDNQRDIHKTVLGFNSAIRTEANDRLEAARATITELLDTRTEREFQTFMKAQDWIQSRLNEGSRQRHDKNMSRLDFFFDQQMEAIEHTNALEIQGNEFVQEEFMANLQGRLDRRRDLVGEQMDFYKNLISRAEIGFARAGIEGITAAEQEAMIYYASLTPEEQSQLDPSFIAAISDIQVTLTQGAMSVAELDYMERQTDLTKAGVDSLKTMEDLKLLGNQQLRDVALDEDGNQGGDQIFKNIALDVLNQSRRLVGKPGVATEAEAKEEPKTEAGKRIEDASVQYQLADPARNLRISPDSVPHTEFNKKKWATNPKDVRQAAAFVASMERWQNVGDHARVADMADQLFSAMTMKGGDLLLEALRQVDGGSQRLSTAIEKSMSPNDTHAFMQKHGPTLRALQLGGNAVRNHQMVTEQELIVLGDLVKQYDQLDTRLRVGTRTAPPNPAALQQRDQLKADIDRKLERLSDTMTPDQALELARMVGQIDNSTIKRAEFERMLEAYVASSASRADVDRLLNK